MLKKYRNVNSRTGRLCILLFGLLVTLNGGQAFSADKKLNTEPNNSKAKSTLTKTRVDTPASEQRLLVRFKKNTTSSAKGVLHKALGSRVKKVSKSVPGLQVVEVGPGKSASKILKQYQKDPSVLYAEPDYEIKLKAVPNDTSFGELWGLHNTGQNFGLTDADINAPQAWDVNTGDSNVVVAVIDTGVDYRHTDLVDNMWVNPGEIPDNGIDDDGNGYADDIHGIDAGENDSDPMDEHGHGTHVSGTIGAKGNNNKGVAGVNWNVSIIACKIFSRSTEGDTVAFVSDAVECLDYLYDLKVNRGVDIIATNNSWGWIGSPSQSLIDAIEQQNQAGILFVAAAGNESLNTDSIQENPSSYYIPNVISVAASTRTDALADFSNFGRRTVHVAAPGEEVLSTVPGWEIPPANNLHNDIFFDNVEGGASGWFTQLTWGTTTLLSWSSANSWTDSPAGNYLNSTNSSLTSVTKDLSAYAGQTTYLGFYVNHDIEDFFDVAYLEISNDGISWTPMKFFTGDSNGWQFENLIIPQSYLTSTFRFRIRLETDESVTRDGIYIDDIGIGINAPPPSTNYDTFDGTSMASPHVVGLIALLKAEYPAYTWSQLKNTVISSGTPRTAFAGKTISGRRIRAFDSNNTGALSCTNQTVLSRLQPRSDTYGVEEGDLVNISMLHVNCSEPAGDVSVTITETGDTITLLDNGLGFDQIAGDGIYSAQIDLSAFGLQNANIEFPDSTTVYARYVYNYLPAVANSYQWRNILATGQPVTVGDDATGYINTPFAIPFGNNTEPFTKLGIDTNGYIELKRIGDPVSEFSIFENFKIPFGGFSNMVSPFWDDLVIDGTTNLMWGVLGSAPNRELVVTWNNVRAFGGQPGISFQVVFSESSSDVIVNYQDVDAPDSFTDFGASATVGIQISPSVGRQYSYNSNSLLNNISLRWSMPTGAVNTSEVATPAVPPANIAPIANAGSIQVVNEGEAVMLLGSGTDSDGSVVSYSWSQVAGIPVVLSNTSAQNPDFTAPDVSVNVSLTFELRVTDNDGATGTDQVTVIVNDLDQAGLPTGRLTPGGGGGSFGFLFILVLPLIMMARVTRKTETFH